MKRILIAALAAACIATPSLAKDWQTMNGPERYVHVKNYIVAHNLVCEKPTKTMDEQYNTLMTLSWDDVMYYMPGFCKENKNIETASRKSQY